MHEKSRLIYTDYKLGMRVKDIAHYYGISLSRVYNIIDKLSYLNSEGPHELYLAAKEVMDDDNAIKFVMNLKRHNIKSVGDLYSYLDTTGGYIAIRRIGGKGADVIRKLIAERDHL